MRVVVLTVSLLAAAGSADRDRAVTKNADGVSLAGEGKAAAALAALEAATERDPSYGWAWLNLGVLHAREGRPAEAQGAWSKGIEVADGEALAELQLRQGQLTFAAANAASLADADQAAKLVEALRLCEAATKASPRPLAHLCVARVQRQRHDLPAADAAYRRAIELDPSLYDAYLELGQMYVDWGHPAVGAEVLEIAVKRDAESLPVRLALGWARLAADQPKAAVTAFDEAVALDPDGPAPRFGLGMAHAASGDDEAAIESLTAFLRQADDTTPNESRKRANDQLMRLML